MTQCTPCCADGQVGKNPQLWSSDLDCRATPRCAGCCTKHYAQWHRYRRAHGINTKRVGGKCWMEFERLAALETDECVIWPFAKNLRGYGRVRRGGSKRTEPMVRTHVEVCERHYGPRPPGMEVAHLPIVCHNPACMNYRHLRWATRRENSMDKALDGTQSLPRSSK